MCERENMDSRLRGNDEARCGNDGNAVTMAGGKAPGAGTERRSAFAFLDAVSGRVHRAYASARISRYRLAQLL